MMIQYRRGDLLAAEQVCICHGCNNRGAFASGVAGLIRAHHPQAYEEYMRLFKEEGLRLGQCIFVPSKGKLIVNCITQDGYGRNRRQYVRYEALNECFAKLNGELAELGYTEVAMPKIGAGLGGGDWKVVEGIIEKQFSNVTPFVYYL